MVPPTVDMPVVGQHQAPKALSAPRGAPQIEVTSDINANGILNMSAQNKFAGRSNQIILTNENGCLSQTETDHVVQEAEECREDDEVNKAKIEAENGLVNHCVAKRNTFIDERHEDKFEVGQERE